MRNEIFYYRKIPSIRRKFIIIFKNRNALSHWGLENKKDSLKKYDIMNTDLTNTQGEYKDRSYIKIFKIK
jgi:hypothetical protein